MKATNDWGSGTSFHGTTIHTTPQKLIDLAENLGADYEDNNNGRDKCNFDFVFENSNGKVFTVYDWKEYRPLGLNETVEFHIGGRCVTDTQQGKADLKANL
jgi:hypothetical protein